MAHKRGSVKNPLEWVTDTVVTANATPTNGRIGLRLDRDEVAEIKKVVVVVDLPFITDAADDNVALFYAASLDPDVVASPVPLAAREDLETFMFGSWTGVMQMSAAGQTIQAGKWRDELELPEDSPILAGSDVGWVVVGDAALAVSWTITLYLTRRRAKPGEKFNVLLSRR